MIKETKIASRTWLGVGTNKLLQSGGGKHFIIIKNNRVERERAEESSSTCKVSKSLEKD